MSGDDRRPAGNSQPNALSDGVQPNRLSNQSNPSSGDLGGTRQATPTIEPRSPARPRASLSMPSVSTFVFIGFVVLTAFRLIGEAADSGDVPPAATPVASAPGAQPSPSSIVAGPIRFGTGTGSECGVTGAAVTFEPGTDVWWSADLAADQAPDAGAVVLIQLNGELIDRQRVPPDPAGGSWNQLCSSEPVGENVAGTYRVEVWVGSPSTLQASGGYTISRT